MKLNCVLGASALHLAIAYFNNEFVQDLVEAGANVNQRAIGKYVLHGQGLCIKLCKVIIIKLYEDIKLP